MTAPLANTQDAAVANLKAWLNGPEDRKTENLRGTAKLFVDAREHFTSPSGDPDWLGRSHAYRSWVRETMSLAGIPADRTSGTLTSIRYHAGNVLRERLPASTLDSLGLKSTSPLQRAQAQNADKSRTLQILDGSRFLSAADMIAALQAAEGILRRVDLAAVAGLKPRDRQVIEATADAVYTFAGAVAEVASGRKRKQTIDSE